MIGVYKKMQYVSAITPCNCKKEKRCDISIWISHTRARKMKEVFNRKVTCKYFLGYYPSWEGCWADYGQREVTVKCGLPNSVKFINEDH